MKTQIEQARILIPPHPLTNFKIQTYYQKEPKFNGVYLRNNLHRMNDGAYVINLDGYKSIGTHWIALHVNGNNRIPSHDAIYFGSFRVEQAYDSIMCEYFCTRFIDFMLKGKSLLDYTNLFSPNNYE